MRLKLYDFRLNCLLFSPLWITISAKFILLINLASNFDKREKDGKRTGKDRGGIQ
jgi:hypothetical protein